MPSCSWHGIGWTPPTVLSVALQRVAWENWRTRSEQRHCSGRHWHHQKYLSPLSLFQSDCCSPCAQEAVLGPLGLLEHLGSPCIAASLGAVLSYTVAGMGDKMSTQRNHSDFMLQLQDCPHCTGGCWSRSSSHSASVPRRGIKELAQPAPGPPGSCLLMSLWSPALGCQFPPYKYSIVLAKTYCTREQGMFQRVPETGSLCCSPT